MMRILIPRLWRYYIVIFIFGSIMGACASTSVVKRDRQASAIHYRMGATSFQKGDQRGAIRDFLAAIKTDPQNAAAHRYLALTYHMLNSVDESEKHYRISIDIDKEIPETHNNLGTLLLDLGRYEEAIVEFDIAMANILYRTPSLAEGNKGWAYYKSGDLPTGVKHLKNAVASNPQFCRGYEWLTTIGIEENDSEMITRYGGEFNRYCAQDESVRELLGESYVQKIQYTLGIGLLQQGQRDSAIEFFKQCVSGPSMDGYGRKCRDSLASFD